jgi:hypothetical protein
MAYNKKYPNIQRTGGPYPRNRYGIRYDSISKQQRRLLLEHPIIKDRAQDDQFLQIVFELCRHRHVDRFDKLYYDWSTEEFVKLDVLKESYDTIDWKCALSDRDIRSNINNFNAENFVHPEYWDTLSGGVDSRIWESSVRFQKHVKKLLLNQQKEFLKLVRKNSKR